MTVIIGVIGAALLFGVFSTLRPRDRACSNEGGGAGGCIGCSGDGACESRRRNGAREDVRSHE